MISTKRKGNGFAISLLSLGIAAASYGVGAHAADCEYVIENEWGSGATAAIRITNTGSSAIDGWDVSWSYDSNRVSNSWNANVSGSNPYTASDMGWNGNIQPGQTVEFGMQVEADGTVETPELTGDVCTDGGSTPPPVSSSSSSAPDDGGGVGGQQCNWYGTTYELCDSQDSGWGWENNQSCIGATTCSSQPDPYGIVGGGDSSAPSSSSSSAPPASSAPSSSAPPASSAPSSSSSSSSSAPPVDPTEGTFRVDETGNITKNGEVMPVQCGSWFGLEGRHEPEDDPDNPGGAPMELFVGNMWWANDGQGTGRTVQQAMDEIKELGINVVRLPISPQTLDPNDPQSSGEGILKNHESVRQDNARQAMEDFIVQAAENDIQVIVGIHSCSNYLGWRAGRLDATPPYADTERVGYEYFRDGYACGSEGVGSDVVVHEYNEELWLDDLRDIAQLQHDLGVDNILGIDIFNEPWDYTWDQWKGMVERAYEAINEVNEDTLILVQGIGSNLSDDTEVPHGDSAYNPNWGENFYSFAENPIDIPRDRLVISPHTYGPSVFVQNHFLDPSQEECQDVEGNAAGEAGCNVVLDTSTLRAGWDQHFGYLADEGYAIVIGEFGGNADWPLMTPQAEQDLWSHQPAGTDLQWQEMFVDYMAEKGMQGCYWSINPESTDTWGLYEHAYEPGVNEDGWGTWLDFDERKVDLLRTLWGQ